MADEDVCKDIERRIREVYPDLKVESRMEYGRICRVEFYDTKDIDLVKQRGVSMKDATSTLEYDIMRKIVIKLDLRKLVPNNVDVYKLSDIYAPYNVTVDYPHKSINISVRGSCPLSEALYIIDRFYRSESYSEFEEEWPEEEEKGIM
jgi:hypothetical protein